MVELTLLRRGSPLAQTAEQLRILNDGEQQFAFERTMVAHGLVPLRATSIQVLQLNLGKLCNQTCRHCHVDAGPDRRESMSKRTAAICLELLHRSNIPTLDITGGAPEMNLHFRWLVTEARKLERRVIDRCNLTILVAPGFETLPEFLASQQVEVVASLPCYLQENVDLQRGDHAFERSVEALRRLNSLGYGKPDSPLILTLVFNPIGPSLPPDQRQLEATYRRELLDRYEIEFTRLFTITNMPISRFLDALLQKNQYDTYMRKLVDAFNPATAESVMCRTMLSVDWQGNLSDCDFNQMLGLTLASQLPLNISDLDDVALARVANRPIMTGQHCFGCTAGAGSSCQGSLSR